MLCRGPLALALHICVLVVPSWAGRNPAASGAGPLHRFDVWEFALTWYPVVKRAFSRYVATTARAHIGVFFCRWLLFVSGSTAY